MDDTIENSDKGEKKLTENEDSKVLSHCAVITPFDERPFHRKPSSSKYRVELCEITHHNVKQLKIINLTVFPVYYSDKFYKNVLTVGDYARLAYFNDVVVGAVCCRLDILNGNVRKLYILTLACLAQYRRLGIGSLMLDYVMQLAERERDPSLKISSVYLHVLVNNDGAVAFYKRHGFKIMDTVPDYYRQILPREAYLLEHFMEPQPDGSDSIVATNGTP